MNYDNDLLHERPRGKKSTNTVQKMTKEELAKTLLKKKECNKKALEIVEIMLNDSVEEDWFLKNLLNIRRNHFQDITEERSILSLCGYPLCSNRLGKVVVHKYHISAKRNKVYDTTERKKFCSNVCFKASMHIENQLLTSPLWFTENSEAPNFTLLPIVQAPSVSSEDVIGDEIMFFPDNLMADDDVPEQNKIDKDFISINQIAEESLIKMQVEPRVQGRRDEPSKRRDNVPSKDVAGSPCTSGTEVPLEETAVKESSCKMATDPSQDHTDVVIAVGSSKNKVPCHEASSTITEPFPNEPHKKEMQTSTLPPENITRQSVKVRVPARTLNTQNPLPARKISHVETCLSEWCTLETLILLLGELKVREMFVEKGKLSAKLNTVLDHRLSDSKFREQYEKITRRLQLLDIEDMQFDGQVRGTPVDDLKPLPSYTDLQDVSRTLELKVNAFYEGKTSYVDSGPIPKQEEAVEENLMPLVDNRAQKTLRRKIVFDQLNRVLPNILLACGFTYGEVSRELRSVVNTLSLSAHNISFKPVEWNLVGFITLHMLAMKDPTLKKQLSSQQAERFHTSLLRGFGEGNTYIEELLLNRLINIDSILSKDVLDA